jgi:RNA polymerase sigma-70 factor, ECF subfamily
MQNTKSSPQSHDNELLVAIAAGNRQALEELYLGYHGRLARFLAQCTQRNEDVQEIINDVFMVVWQKAKDFRRASQACTWITGIAYGTALKSLRRQNQFASAKSVDDQLEQTSGGTPETETKDVLDDGLNRLPLEQRLTLVLEFANACDIKLIDGPALEELIGQIPSQKPAADSGVAVATQLKRCRARIWMSERPSGSRSARCLLPIK